MKRLITFCALIVAFLITAITPVTAFSETKTWRQIELYGDEKESFSAIWWFQMHAYAECTIRIGKLNDTVKITASIRHSNDSRYTQELSLQKNSRGQWIIMHDDRFTYDEKQANLIIRNKFNDDLFFAYFTDYGKNAPPEIKKIFADIVSDIVPQK